MGTCDGGRQAAGRSAVSLPESVKIDTNGAFFLPRGRP
jgi:hypothetical protein